MLFSGFPNGYTFQKMTSRLFGLLFTNENWILNEFLKAKMVPNLRSMQIDVHQHLYKIIQELRPRKDKFGIFRLFYFEVTIPFVGNTSLVQQVNLVDYETGLTLTTSYSVSVFVTAEKHQLAVIPDNIKARINRQLSEPKKFMRVPTVPEIPTNVYTELKMTFYSDLDLYQHMTAPMYVNKFINVASNAVMDGFLQGFKHENGGCYMLERYCGHFHSETKFGDELLFSVWQDKNDLKLVYCKAVRKNDGSLVYTGLIKYGEAIET